MATWTLNARLTNATDLLVNATDRIWWSGSATDPTVNIVVSAYQDGTHITNSSDVHQCTTNHVNNTKWLADSGASSVSLNGAAASDVTALTTGNVGLRFTFSDVSVTTTNGKFYAYDGTTDATPMAGVTFKAIEITGAQTTWVTANGSASALNLADNSAATSHDFYIGTSVSPTSTGLKTGKVKISLTYV